MAASCQTVAETIADVLKRRPVLEPVLRFFEPVLIAQADVAAGLTRALRASAPRLPEFDPERARQGASLLAGVPLTGAASAMRRSAKKLLPLLAGLEAMKTHVPALEAFFLKPARKGAQDRRELLAEAVVSGDAGVFERLGGQGGLEPALLEFVTGLVLAPVLRAMTARIPAVEGEAPWDAGNVWRQGYCPVCGSLPSMGWFDKPALEEKNAFLVSGGGKKHLHCGLCGADWKFRRGACPACGKEGGVMELLRESGPAQGERLDWCTSCKAYCPTVDLRERESRPNLDALALGMMHLDMVAADKKLHPLKPSFWNRF
ncbi:MAG: formate dehydrogenase accessory protein FdhE [Desulfovibrio sp.]|jgi:FdhE protein|nr:formate dehydrogenase accessory protein FdhE [Desulfovibrio sp.]